jgi:DNA-binding Lrp family transcriptional regulator
MKNYNGKKAKDLSEILIENSKYRCGLLKERLIQNKTFQNNCFECGLKDYWNDKKIILQLDHINGNRYDNRIENLRLLCPNCHSQTKNFAGKNIKNKRPKSINYCKKCSIKVYKKNSFCKKCCLRKSKINWPSIKELQMLLTQMSCQDLAKKLGVSDRAIYKKIKKCKTQQ